MKLKNKIAVVTGASAGLGAAIAKALTKKGTTVYGLARNTEKLNHLKEELGENFIPVVQDVSDEKALKNWVEKTFSSAHFPQILINNAGVSQFDKVEKLSSEKWHQMVDINLSAVHFLTAALVPLMKKDKSSSHIINTGSILGKVSGVKKAAYSATKFAIQGYSEALFKELRGHNIKVTCINPGSIDTNFFESSGIKSNEQMLQPAELAEVYINVLETAENVLIDELTVRPLRPR